MNHGAFGGCARAPYLAANHYRHRCETQPLRFFDRELLSIVILFRRWISYDWSMIVHCTHSEQYRQRCLRRFGTPPFPTSISTYLPAWYFPWLHGSKVLMPNATTATNIVARNAGLTPGSNVVVLDVGYGSTKKIFQRLCDDVGATPRVVSTSLTASLDDDTKAFDEGLLVEQIAGSIDASTRLVVVDHVTSNTAFRLPIKTIASKCREMGTLCLVDGAHGLLQVGKALKPRKSRCFYQHQRSALQTCPLPLPFPLPLSFPKCM